MSLIECPESRSQKLDKNGTITELTLRYKLTGVASETTARSTAASSISTTYSGTGYSLVRQDGMILTPEWVDTASQDGVWEIEVTYAQDTKPKPLAGTQRVQIEIGGETAHYTESLETMGFFPVAASTPDFNKAVNVTDDGVQGADVDVPTMTITVTKWLAPASVTASYIATLYGLAKSVNNASFSISEKEYVNNSLTTIKTYTLAAGECLFDSCTKPVLDDNGLYVMTFVFKASPNKTNITVGDGITVSSKKGWEYLWVYYRKAVDDTVTPKRILQKALWAFVERMYPENSFTGIGL